MKEKKRGSIGYIVAFMIFMSILGSLFGEDDDIGTKDKTNASQETEYAENTSTPKPKTKKKTFYEELEKNIGNKKVSKKTYKILKEEIGFTKLKYRSKIKGTTNYKIKANEYNVVVTASDKLYRIFTPGEYTWYEDRKVKNTYENIKKKEKRTKISSEARSYYYIMAQGIVEQCLANAKSAKFPSINSSGGDIVMRRNGKLVTVQSYVDVKNGFGATVRNNWTAQFKVKNIEEFSCTRIYLNIGGKKLFGKFRK